MLAKTLMRDPVTTKLQRDSVSGKLMVANPYGADCEYCTAGETPKYITLTVSGLSDCDACFRPITGEGPYKRYKTSGVAAVLNTCVVILEQTASCRWEKNYTGGDFGTLIHYSDPSADCTGTPTEYAIDELSFFVQKCAADGLIIGIAVKASVIVEWGMQAFAYDIRTGDLPTPWQCKTAEITDCIAVSNLTNTWFCVDNQYLAWDVCCESGLVSIVEGAGGHYAPPSIQYQRRLPTGDSAVQWSRSAGSNNYELVDDPYASPDDDSTYTYTNVQTNKDLFSFIPLAVPAGSVITNVQVIGRFRRMDAGGDYLIRELLKVNGVTYEGAMQQLPYGLPSVFVDRLYTWTVNPNTGLAWTIDDVNGIGSNPLQTFGHECIGFQKTVRCTQVYVKVNYEYIW